MSCGLQPQRPSKAPARAVPLEPAFDPVLSLLPRWLPLAVITLVAFWLRTHQLARRRMHAAEANQAGKAGELLETGRYVFDPRDHHGPTLYYAVLPVAWLRGEHTLARLSETTVRLVPALAGTLAVVLLAVFATPLGRWPALIAAALLALSPPAVYYSRDFIQETLLLTFTLGGCICAQRWWRDGRLRWALAAGACLGLMQATKASAPLFALAALLAAIVAGGNRPTSARWGRDLGLAMGAAFAVAALLYASFGTHLAGIPDALAAYAYAWGRVTGPSGHEKPWWYYLQLFGWHRDGGLLWHHLTFTAAALAGLGVALFTRQKYLRGIALYTGLIFCALSCVAYKTPWHAIHAVPGMALLGAGAFAALAHRPWGRLLAGAALMLTFLSLGQQTRLAAFQRPADARNPYAYVHSSPDVLKVRDLAAAALARTPDKPIRIISEEYWPLPWYLRGLPRVGYWSAPPAECDGALLIVSATQADVVRTRLRDRYRESFLGLRPGVLCVIMTPE